MCPLSAALALYREIPKNLILLFTFRCAAGSMCWNGNTYQQSGSSIVCFDATAIYAEFKSMPTHTDDSKQNRGWCQIVARSLMIRPITANQRSVAGTAGHALPDRS